MDCENKLQKYTEEKEKLIGYAKQLQDQLGQVQQRMIMVEGALEALQAEEESGDEGEAEQVGGA